MRTALRITVTGAAAAALLAGAGAAHASWPVRVGPAAASAAARTVPAAAAPATTVAGADVTVRWSALEIAPGVPVAGYRIARYDADTGAPWSLLAGCAGVRTGTSCTEVGLLDGRWRYTVTPVVGAHWTGGSSPPGPVTVVATRIAQTTVTFPADGASYGTAAFTAGCGSTAAGDLCGTAQVAGGATIVSVSASLRRGAGDYWDPATGAFSSPGEKLFAVGSGTADWRLPFPVTSFPAAGSYTLRAVTMDDYGRSTTASSTFTVDPDPPTALDVQATDHGGTTGRAETGDRLTLTFDEPVAPGTVLPTWTGGPVAVQVVLDDGGGAGSNDAAEVRAGGVRVAALGWVDLGAGGYVNGGDVTFEATMIRSGDAIVVTLGAVSAGGSRLRTQGSAGTMTWTTGPASAGLADPAGNPLANPGSAVAERRTPTAMSPADREF